MVQVLKVLRVDNFTNIFVWERGLELFRLSYGGFVTDVTVDTPVRGIETRVCERKWEREKEKEVCFWQVNNLQTLPTELSYPVNFKIGTQKPLGHT